MKTLENMPRHGFRDTGIMTETASKMFVFRDRDHSNAAFENLAAFRANGLLCDIVLSVEGREIPAHRVILAAGSPYFRAMFLGKLAESCQDRVVLYEIDGVAVEVLVQYAYSGVAEINECNVQSLLYASAVLQFDKVRHACCVFLQKALRVYNCLGIRLLAECLSCHNLFESSHQFVADHFDDVLKQEEFLLQPFESLDALLDCKFLSVACKEKLLNGVLEWLNFRPLERQRHAPCLIKRFCSTKVSSDFLKNCVLKDPIIQGTSECQRMILEAMQSSNTPDTHKFNGTALRSHRTGREIILTIGGESEGMYLSSSQCLCSNNDRWSWDIPGQLDDLMPLAPMKKGRNYMAAASTGCHVYIIGGNSSKEVLDCVERYEWPSNEWHQLSPLHVERMGAAAAILNGQPIAIGGFSKFSGYLSSVEVYDSWIDNWSLITPMRTKRNYLGAAEIAGSVYAIGGFGGENESSYGYLTSVECFEAQRGIWQSVSPLSEPRAYLSAVQKDGETVRCS